MSILKYKDPKTGEFKRINPYKADLSFVGKDGITVNKATDSEEVEISGKGCVQKNTTANGVVYGIDYSKNEVTIQYSDNESKNTIAQRTSSGEVKAVVSGNPTDNTLINKKYGEDNYVKKVKFTNLEQALYGYILDTTEETYADLDSAVLKDSVSVGDNVYPIADKTRALVTRIEGKTTKMVQLLDKSTFPATKTENGVTFTNNGDGTITVNGTATSLVGYILFNYLTNLVAGHKYLLYGAPNTASAMLYIQCYDDTNNEWLRDNGNGGIAIFPKQISNSTGSCMIRIRMGSGYTANNIRFEPQLFDLTAMNREDITSAEQFKAEFPDLYPYENGNIYPAKISGVKFMGKNLLDFNTVSRFFNEIIIGLTINVEDDKVHITGSPTELGSLNIIKTSNLSLIGKNYRITAFDITGSSIPSTVSLYGLRNVDIHGQIALNLNLSGMKIGNNYDFYFKVMVSAGNSTAYEPYTEPVSVTLPETYDLHGIGDYKDYLEITKNENNELYTLKKVQSVEVNESEKTITPLATPVETVIATNLTYEQVTAIRHNSGLIEVEGNTNKGYARPTVKNTVVYRLTATSTAEG